MESTSTPRSVPRAFAVSSFCTGGDCVGVDLAGDGVEVIDTKASGRDAGLRFTRDEWAAFVAGVKAGEFDLD